MCHNSVLSSALTGSGTSEYGSSLASNDQQDVSSIKKSGLVPGAAHNFDCMRESPFRNVRQITSAGINMSLPRLYLGTMTFGWSQAK